MVATATGAIDKMSRAELLARLARGEREFRGADLRGFHLGGIDLTGADLRGADLRGTDLRKATLGKACLAQARLCPSLCSRFAQELLAFFLGLGSTAPIACWDHGPIEFFCFMPPRIVTSSMNWSAICRSPICAERRLRRETRGPKRRRGGEERGMGPPARCALPTARRADARCLASPHQVCRREPVSTRKPVRSPLRRRADRIRRLSPRR